MASTSSRQIPRDLCGLYADASSADDGSSRVDGVLAADAVGASAAVGHHGLRVRGVLVEAP
jgi:hypothetical protein